MSIPQSDDVMLMYQSTSYHDIAAIREMLDLETLKSIGLEDMLNAMQTAYDRYLEASK